jgi:putative endonuclease
MKRTAYAIGMSAEDAVVAAYSAEGLAIRARRLRTKAGELDILAEREGLLAAVEVKCRPTLADAALSLTERQRARLAAAIEIVLAENPDWGAAGARFDLVVVDRAGRMRRVADAFRAGD